MKKNHPPGRVAQLIEVTVRQIISVASSLALAAELTIASAELQTRTMPELPPVDIEGIRVARGKLLSILKRLKSGKASNMAALGEISREMQELAAMLTADQFNGKASEA